MVLLLRQNPKKGDDIYNVIPITPLNADYIDIRQDYIKIFAKRLMLAADTFVMTRH